MCLLLVLVAEEFELPNGSCVIDKDKEPPELFLLATLMTNPGCSQIPRHSETHQAIYSPSSLTVQLLYNLTDCATREAQPQWRGDKAPRVPQTAGRGG